jgi:hypothetical protein
VKRTHMKALGHPLKEVLSIVIDGGQNGLVTRDILKLSENYRSIPEILRQLKTRRLICTEATDMQEKWYSYLKAA